MKTLIALIFALLILPGCASPTASPQVQELQVALQLKQTYTAALSGMNAAHRLGLLPTSEKVKIEPVRAAAESAIDQLQTVAVSGTSSQWDAAWQVALAAMAKFAGAQTNAVDAATAPSATQPATDDTPAPPPAPAE